jgi:TP901 family phage tail tape measure protein
MIEDVARLRLTVDSTGLTEARSKINSLGKSGKSASGSLKGLASSSTATKVALGSLAVGVTAVGVTVVKTTKKWLEFNVAMKEVETIAGATGKQMKSLRLDALKVAQSVGVDATEAAQGFYQAISAGIPTEDVKEFVKVSAELGKGGLADIGSSTDLLTTALNAYGKSAGEARKVSDQLFRTVKLGKTNIPQLASSLARVAPVASTAGVKLEELLGIVASTTKQGVKTAESMTQIKAAIVALLNPSETMADIFNDIGVSSGRQLIAQEGLAGALEKVRIASAGNDKVLNQALKSIEAYSLSATITKDKLEDTADAIEEIGIASGDTAKASKIAGDELGTSFEKLGNALLILAENANQATGASEGLSGAIADLADKLADPDLPKAYAKSFMEFPAVFAKFIFLAQGMEEQVSKFDSKVELSIDTQRRYAEAIRKSAEARRMAGESQIDVAEKVLHLEKALEMQKAITAGLGGEERIKLLDQNIEALNTKLKIGAMTVSEYQKGLEKLSNLKGTRTRLIAEVEATKQLELQLQSYKRIGEGQNEISKEQFRIAVEAQRLNEALKNSKITTEQWRAETEKLKKQYDNIEQRAKGFSKTFATFFGGISSVNSGLVKGGERALEIANAQARVDEILLANTDENIALIEKQLTHFDDLLTQKKQLTEAEQGIRNLLLNQLGILKEQSKEAKKSRATLDFEGLQSRYRTKEEQASLDYAGDLGKIEKGGASEEEKEMLRQRAFEQFQQQIAQDDEEGAISKAVDEQAQIDQQIESLQQYYMTELELQQAHEKQKRDLIMEATNLTANQQKDLLNKVAEEGKKQRVEIAKQETEQKLRASQEFLGGMASLASVFGKKGFKAYQALAIAEATVATYLSASKAMAKYPPPFNAIAAAGAIAGGLAQVANIKSQKPPAYQMGGIVGGSSYGGDQELARVNSGEMILNQTQQKNLFAMANNPIGGNNKRGSVTIINQTGSDISGDVEENQDGDLQIVIEKAVKQTKDELTNEANYGGGNFLPSLEKNYGLART